LEYADDGDLFQKITHHQNEKSYIKEEEIWRIFITIVRGLRSLHEFKIFHRDLKSANVFLNKDGAAKFGDMNVSKQSKKGCCTLKQELLTTPVLKCGETNPTTRRVTSGPWAACSMNP